ncbi:o-succinylbenzoate--CoA ligase [Halarcobacter ebronensis]|uniref:O-succinylbenzoate--CoA ligase n=1 Tax=Halarcobacter ebronensis TaxID=1462615 RepID=A0A4Q0YBA1_9BACT|nr:fatty acid--CoA ligase family protein [Halarcobacter ebronensis]RXJ66834.1 o-succinylbenzoate--CoA ligase [Halarcobacter ebronensis]
MNFMEEKFNRFDSSLAIVCDDREYCYKELLNKISEYKEQINSSIKPNSVVAILGDYSFENIALFFALYDKKNIIVPITSMVEAIKKEYMQESFCNYSVNCGQNGLEIENINQRATNKMIENLQESNSSGLVLFSSGSTAKPKAMIHNLDNLIQQYKEKREKSINMLLFLMFDHIGGLNTMFNALSMGATLIIPKNRDAKTICELIEKYRIMVLPSSPTFLNLILISGEYLNYNLSSLRMITYGTEAMPESLLKKLKEIFPRVKFLQTFGTSETGISTTSSQASDSLYMKLDDPNCEYKIVDNELWLRSKTQVLGYLNASMDSFTEDGWFKTGDLVELIEDNYIKIIGRGKEVINVGGQKVLPTEVESVILNLEDVVDCMVYGEKNSITGQSVVCDIVYKEKIEQRELKKLVRGYCKEKLEVYKIPTKVNLVERTNYSTRFKKIRRKDDL